MDRPAAGSKRAKTMARGWESKSIEEQQAEASSRPATAKKRLTPQQAEAQHKIEALRLSRQRTLQQLEKAQNPNHHKMLQEALRALDEQLQELEKTP